MVSLFSGRFICFYSRPPAPVVLCYKAKTAVAAWFYMFSVLSSSEYKAGVFVKGFSWKGKWRGGEGQEADGCLFLLPQLVHKAIHTTCGILSGLRRGC